MSTYLDIQLEEISRALLLVVKDNINQAIDEVWDEMSAEDTAYFAALGESVPVTPKLYPARFFLGYYPSILERPVEDYPNIAVMCDSHRSMDDAGDQYEVSGSDAYIEAFVLHEDEATVNRLAYRYAKAIHRVIAQNKNLADPDVDAAWSTPAVDVSNAAARRVSEWSEAVTYIQGCRLEYTFRSTGAW